MLLGVIFLFIVSMCPFPFPQSSTYPGLNEMMTEGIFKYIFQENMF